MKMINSDTRGQTQIDFAIGVGIFLIVLVFAITFIPTLLQPFNANQANFIQSDRVANQLTGDLWVNADEPQQYVLEEDCVEYFFELHQGASVGVPPSYCNVDSSKTTLQDATGLSQSKGVNVTIEGATPGAGIQTYNGVALRAGDPIPDVGDVIVSTRVVHFNGDDYRMFVRIWGA